MSKIVYIPGFVLLALLSCCTHTLDRNEYVQWVRDYDNGLHVSKWIGEYDLDVQYQPAQYVRLQKMGTGSYQGEPVGENGGGALQYYLLTLGLHGKNTDFISYGVSDAAEKQRKLYYFSYRFQDEITLEEGDEKLPCVLYHFEKPVDLKGSRTILLGFEQRTNKPETATLKIDSDQFGSLPVRIKISKANIPHVALR
ncbi:MAG TPA: hypothetical protein VK658_23270 [Chryseolinea sp.]|nr:hypothetical protein [Chryseolinea sp.]